MSGSPLHGIKKWDPLTSPGTSTHMIIKDLGEIHSRLLDHRPVIQGETRYFVKEFEQYKVPHMGLWGQQEKRGFREMRVLENVKRLTSEANDKTLPRCKEAMQGGLDQALQTLKVANRTLGRLQQRQHQPPTNDPQASEDRLRARCDELVKEQEQWQVAVDEEHKKAMERLREQYARMEKELAKSASF
ncbi:biogenesis of lysosome-related organelles complex 1 subunit 5 isoform X1 [Ambystoma mexicanum]|uniref:biogenesis of lysosome-related organelles complex 1 subunit 5 isoform X1 n=1 Tax=Ambystoma mexicanum TaxID=8296 RepID=UPI0037E920B7